jgi:hypothetical protein
LLVTEQSQIEEQLSVQRLRETDGSIINMAVARELPIDRGDARRKIRRWRPGNSVAEFYSLGVVRFFQQYSLHSKL